MSSRPSFSRRESLKSLGQHFLIDEGVVDRIVASIAPQKHDNLLEIGPGHGALTWPLLEKLAGLHVVEVDRRLSDRLKQQSRNRGANLTVHCADALSFDYRQLCDRTALRVVGNLPYNIASPLLFCLFDKIDCVADMHVMRRPSPCKRVIKGLMMSISSRPR